MTRWLVIALLALLPFGHAFAAGDELQPIPALSGFVTDTTGTLTEAQKTDLAKRLDSIAGARVAILLVPSVKPESIEQFGIRVADAWKIGKDKVDNGIIVIVAKTDRMTRIEVGYGLEGAIPDVVAKHIVTAMNAKFASGQIFDGLATGVSLLADEVAKEHAVNTADGVSPAVVMPEWMAWSLLIILPVVLLWCYMLMFGDSLSGLFGSGKKAKLAGDDDFRPMRHNVMPGSPMRGNSGTTARTQADRSQYGRQSRRSNDDGDDILAAGILLAAVSDDSSRSSDRDDSYSRPSLESDGGSFGGGGASGGWGDSSSSSSSSDSSSSPSSD